MPHWRYGLVAWHTDDESGVALHEVYLDDDGMPNGWTLEPTSFSGANPTEVIQMLQNALYDVGEHEPINETDRKEE